MTRIRVGARNHGVDDWRILPPEPITDLDAYLGIGGGEGLWRARRSDPHDVVDLVRRSGLRGRGGAGFPTGVKWQTIASADPGQTRYVVCNAAEGEPGTFKDRAILRSNPYQVLEGIAIACHAVGAVEAYIGIKASFTRELEVLHRAVDEIRDAGLLEGIGLTLVRGPEDYLFGEEKALLEVIEGRDPLPRWYPPYLVGLHAGLVAGVGAGSAGPWEVANPTLVNNVETLANIPSILRNGPDWFRQVGTDRSPGTMVFTVSGDTRVEGVFELPLGVPLAVLVDGMAGGTDRPLKAVLPGASNQPIPGELIDTPAAFETLAEIGSGLGSGGFVVFDDSACMADVGRAYSRFLAEESCGQCPPCKLGCTSLADLFDRLETGDADPYLLQEMAAWTEQVTDANRCGLGAGERALAAGILNRFSEELASHIPGGCTVERRVQVAKLVDLVEGRFVTAPERSERPD